MRGPGGIQGVVQPDFKHSLACANLTWTYIKEHTIRKNNQRDAIYKSGQICKRTAIASKVNELRIGVQPLNIDTQKGNRLGQLWTH